MSTNYYDAENNKLIKISGKGDFPADYGTKEEFETKKDSLPDGTVFTTTDEFVDAHAENYSTDEVVIGTWIDGKPIYRRVIENVAWTSNEWNSNILSKIDVSTMDNWIYVCGVIPNQRVVSLIQFDKGSGLYVVASTVTEATHAFLIMEYTKK